MTNEVGTCPPERQAQIARYAGTDGDLDLRCRRVLAAVDWTGTATICTGCGDQMVLVSGGYVHVTDGQPARHTGEDVDLREEVARYADRVDAEVDAPDLRRVLWSACDEAIRWSWESVASARDVLTPVVRYFTRKDDCDR